MASIAVVMLNVNCMSFADDMALRWQNLGEGVPMVSIESAVLQMSHFLVEPSEGCRITTAEYPGHGSPCITVNGFNDP